MMDRTLTQILQYMITLIRENEAFRAEHDKLLAELELYKQQMKLQEPESVNTILIENKR